MCAKSMLGGLRMGLRLNLRVVCDWFATGFATAQWAIWDFSATLGGKRQVACVGDPARRACCGGHPYAPHARARDTTSRAHREAMEAHKASTR